MRLLSRNRKRLNDKYPEITAAFHRQKTDAFIADGEIVTFKDGVTSFAKLQQRMQVERPSADLLRKVPVCLYLFDLLYLDQYDTRQLPLRYRKVVLRKAFEFRDPLRFTEHRETEGEAYYREACRRRWEGVMAKNGDRCTSPGERAIGSNSSAAKNRSSLSAVTRIRAGSGSA